MEETAMKNSEKPPVPTPDAPYRVARVFEGARTAEQVLADLIKVHSAS